MSRLGRALARGAAWLEPQRETLLQDWVRSLTDVRGVSETGVAARCAAGLDRFLRGASSEDVEGFLAEEALVAEREARRGASLLGAAVEIRLLGRSVSALLPRLCPEPSALAETLVAFEEVAGRRLEILLAAQEAEAARRLVDTQEQAARATEQARELRRANEALRRAETESRHRAEQLALLSAVAHRIAPIRVPEEVMQQAADQIRARMNHTYVAVVVLDDEGVLVGRWAGRPGVGRTSAGRAQAPLGGVIGRAIRERAPQVVGDVVHDPDYKADVPGTRSEMAIPLLDGAEAVGAIDFQSEQPFAFALDDVAAGETLAEFLVVAVRNARLFQEARRRSDPSQV